MCGLHTLETASISQNGFSFGLSFNRLFLPFGEGWRGSLYLVSGGSPSPYPLSFLSLLFPSIRYYPLSFLFFLSSFPPFLCPPGHHRGSFGCVTWSSSCCRLSQNSWLAMWWSPYVITICDALIQQSRRMLLAGRLYTHPVDQRPSDHVHETRCRRCLAHRIKSKEPADQTRRHRPFWLSFYIFLRLSTNRL